MLSYVVLLIASSIITCPVTAVPLSFSDCLQVPQEKESDSVQAEGVSCVASGKELYQAFLRRGLVPSKGHYFDVHHPDRQYYMSYTTFTMVSKTNILQVNDTVNMTYVQPEPASERCCNTSDPNCSVVQTRRHFVYRILPAPLLYMLALPWATLFTTRGWKDYPNLHIAFGNEFIGCWNTPPLCACHQRRLGVLNDFTAILFYKNSIGVESLQRSNVQTWMVGVTRENAIYASIIFFLSILMSLLTLKPALKVLKRCKPERDRLVLSLQLAVQINSWLQFSVYTASYFVSVNSYTSYLADAPQAVRYLHIPFVTVGNYFLIAMASIFLLEFPFVGWYFAKRQKQTTNSRNTCKFQLKRLAHTFGLTGMVFFMQILGGFSVFSVLLFLVSPLIAILSLTIKANATLFLILFTAFLIYPCQCMAQNARRKCFQGCGVILFSLLGSAGALGFSVLLITVAVENLTAPLNASQIATSILSSCMLAVFAYIAKVTLPRQLWLPNIAVREDINEERPLLELDDVE